MRGWLDLTSAHQRRRRRPAAIVGCALLVVWLAAAGSTGVSPTPRIVAASPSAASALGVLPAAGELPPGFREVGTDLLGGPSEPALSARRTFLAASGDRRVEVTVTVGPTAPAAQRTVDDRANQLIRYWGWAFAPNLRFGEQGYRGRGSGAEGWASEAALFRIDALAADVRVDTAFAAGDGALLERVAALVEARMIDSEGLLAEQPGFPATPAPVPGKEPPGPPIAFGGGSMGGAVTGAGSGAPVRSDTVVLLTVTGIDRPWVFAGSAPPPGAGTNYLTVNTQIDVQGPTSVELALSDFRAVTFDGREWSPVAGREPALRDGQAVMTAPAGGWLTFRLPTDQQALQLVWRLRTSQSLTGQGAPDQTLVVPLIVGAAGTASTGTTAPPAGIPVVPPPGGDVPVGPTSPSGPTGPSTAPGSAPRGAPRLQ